MCLWQLRGSDFEERSKVCECIHACIYVFVYYLFAHIGLSECTCLCLHFLMCVDAFVLTCRISVTDMKNTHDEGPRFR